MDATVSALINRIPRFRSRQIEVQALGGGLTNRNYCLTCGAERFVLRVAGENSELLGIDRQTEYDCARAAFGAGIAPEVLEFYPEHKALLTRFVPGRVLTVNSIRNPPMLRRVVAALRQYHEAAGGAGAFSAFDTVRRYYAHAVQRQVTFPADIGPALEKLNRIEQEVGAPGQLCFCHNDLLASNLIYDGQEMWILDWEYAGKGDLFFDLGNLAANNRFGEELERELLKLYFGSVRAADLRRLRLMRLASDMREAMWGFLQLGISTLSFDYQAYASGYLRRFLKKSPG